ncbi:uncharacterized protein LOC133195293 [Saccostrea echinata]|uniref:uncharacterized protein LOC133195293 n=1 Tax=Saccostrea echinata TaxID=191078 RepID=UPI002A7ED586|nr:uncharacterized protein LOC133195293 [Saccostrea echinata]
MWEDDDHLCRLLADSLANTVGFLPVQRLNRRVDDILSDIHYHGRNVEVVKTGSWAEGFRMRGTDVDRMYIDKTAMASETPEKIPNKFCAIKIEKYTDIQRGYAKLILLTPDKAEQHLQLAVVREAGSLYVSSKVYIESYVGDNQETHGPCVRRVAQHGTEQDDAHCLSCPHWPSDAMEWYHRRRQNGWPELHLLRDIYNKGCHVVPIGRKFIDRNGLWCFDPMTWRFSFSVAEKRLVYTFNDTQFLVYGIFKLLVKEAFRETRNVLCSYFMKTLLFWCIEETPKECWRQERLVSCIEICFKRLILWVSNGYCPNYFVRENNMFLGKLDEVERESLFIHLSELYGEGWRCLLTCPSLHDLKEALQKRRLHILEATFDSYGIDPDEDFRGLSLQRRNDSSTSKEDIEDRAFFSQLESVVKGHPNFRSLEKEFFNAVALLLGKEIQLNTLMHDTVTLYMYKTLQHIAMIFYYKAMNDTSRCARFRYRQIRRALDLMKFTDSADISRGRLTLATAFYCMGYYRDALKMIRQYEVFLDDYQGVLYISSRFPDDIGEEYIVNFCNSNFSRIKKASIGVSYDFEVFRTMPIYPKEIAFEILLMKDSSAFISFPPRPYSIFLKALCFSKRNDMYNVKILMEELQSILLLTNDGAMHLIYTMIAILETKLDRFDNAYRNFYLAYWHKKYLTWRQEHCFEWDSLQSPLLHVAVMVRLLI